VKEEIRPPTVAGQWPPASSTSRPPPWPCWRLACSPRCYLLACPRNLVASSSKRSQSFTLAPPLSVRRRDLRSPTEFILLLTPQPSWSLLQLRSILAHQLGQLVLSPLVGTVSQFPLTELRHGRLHTWPGGHRPSPAKPLTPTRAREPQDAPQRFPSLPTSVHWPEIRFSPTSSALDSRPGTSRDNLKFSRGLIAQTVTQVNALRTCL